MSERTEPEMAIARGRVILDPVFLPFDFSFVWLDCARGSGGDFARAAYVGAGRRCSFSYQWSLGEVLYTIGATTVSHSDFISGAARRRVRGKYPGLARGSGSAFAHLADDLYQYGADFLRGDSAAMADLLAWIAAYPRSIGFSALGDAVIG